MFGNVGLGGGLHAALAPLATLLITNLAYAGSDPRSWLHAKVGASASVVDLGCGTGTSTRVGGVGIDASSQMVSMARLIRDPSSRFEVGDAETWGEEDAFDACTVCFVLHEMPRAARLRTLLNAARLSKASAYALDICPTYSPSPTMRAGEPYVDDYLQNIDHDLNLAARLTGRVLERTDVVPGHVVCWALHTPPAAAAASAGA